MAILALGLALGLAPLPGTMMLLQASAGIAAAQVAGLAGSGPWMTETVDHAETLAYTSLAIDGAGDIHVAYADMSHTATLRYAVLAVGAWHNVTVGPGPARVGEYASLGLVSTPPYTRRIAYYDYTSSALKHAWLDGSSWYSETIDDNEDVGRMPALALEPTCTLHAPHRLLRQPSQHTQARLVDAWRLAERDEPGRRGGSRPLDRFRPNRALHVPPYRRGQPRCRPETLVAHPPRARLPATGLEGLAIARSTAGPRHAAPPRRTGCHAVARTGHVALLDSRASGYHVALPFGPMIALDSRRESQYNDARPLA